MDCNHWKEKNINIFKFNLILEENNYHWKETNINIFKFNLILEENN